MEDKLNKLIYLLEKESKKNDDRWERLLKVIEGKSISKRNNTNNLSKDKYTLEDLKKVVSKLIKEKELTESNHKFIENIIDFCKQKGYVTSKQFQSVSNMLEDNFHYMNKIKKSYE